MSRPNFPALAAELVDEVKRGAVAVAHHVMPSTPDLHPEDARNG